MTSIIATAGKVSLFSVVVIGGAMITLPAPKVSFAAQHPIEAVSHSALQEAEVSTLVGLRTRQKSSESGAAASKPVATFGKLDIEPFVSTPHTGTLRYGSESITLPFDTATDTYAFGPMRLKHSLVKTIVHASFLAGVDPRLLMAIADKESSFLIRARAPTSSATGLFQFIESTWLLAIRDYGPRFGLQREAGMIVMSDGGPTIAEPQDRAAILDMRNDPFLSTLMAASMLRAEQEKLSGRLGRPVSDAEVYLVHFLGPAGAQKFLSVLAEKPKASAASLLPQAAKANRPIFYAARTRKAKSLSVAQVHEKIGSSLERRLTRYRDLDFGPATAFAPMPPRARLEPDPFANWRL